MALRVKMLEGDYRRNPKTSDYCVRCQKDLKPGQGRRWVRMTVDGEVIHPDDVQLLSSEDWGTRDRGEFQIGADCARKLGLEWCLLTSNAPAPCQDCNGWGTEGESQFPCSQCGGTGNV